MGIAISDFRMAIKIDNSEAKNKLIETRKEVQKLEKTLEELEATGKKETDEYKEKRKQLRKLNQSYNDLRKEAGLNALTYNELRKSARSLKSQLEKTVPDSDQYKELQRDLEITIKRMKELKGVSVDTSFSFSKLADGFNRYGALIASGIASVTGLTLTMRKCVDAYAEMEEAQSQVIKYTGLSKDEVRELNEEFKNLDTRTPRTRLNELAGDAGKLGISAKKDVMEFVQAADMINVALGEDLGKDAITQIGKLAQMFGDGDRSLKDNMLAVGSAVNSVAQSSSASEPYLVEFTARMGGVGKQAKLAVTDIMGYASALDQNMLRSEMASTALSGLILKLYQEPAKYAKLAGIQVEEFTKLMAEDANEAVLVFLEALNRLGGMEQLAPVLDKMSLSGAEAASVISTLAGSVAQVRKEQQGANQAFVEGTSIVNEFAVQNSTVQAELDKAKQRFHDITVELGEQLLPLMKYMVTTGSLTVKALSAIVSALIDYKGILVAAVSVIGAYIAGVKMAALWEDKHRASVLLNNTVLKAKNLWTKTVTASNYALAASTALFTGKLTRANIALKALFNIIKLNPLGLILASVTALGIGIYKLVTHVSSADKAMNSFFERVASEQAELNKLYSSLKNAAYGTEQRKEMIDKFNSAYGTYLPNLLDEKSTLDDIKDAYNRVTEAMRNKIAQQMLQEQTSDIRAESIKNEAEILLNVQKLLSKGLSDKQVAKIMPTLVRYTEEMISKGSSAVEVTNALTKSLGYQFDVLNLKMKNGNLGVDVLSDIRLEILDYVESVKKSADKIDSVKKRLNPFISSESIESKPSNVLDEVVIKPDIFTSPSVADNDTNDYDKKLSELTKFYQLQENMIKSQYQKGEVSEEDYQSKLYDIQIKHLSARIELLKAYSKDASSLEGQLLDAMIARSNKLYKDQQDEKSKKYEEEIKAENLKYDNQLLDLKKYYASSQMAKEEYDKKIEELEREHLDRLISIRSEYGMDTTDLETQKADKDVSDKESSNAQSAKEGLAAVNMAESEKSAMMMLDAMYQAGIISYEQYEKAKTAITEKFEDERNNIREKAFKTAMNLLSSVSQLMTAMQDSEISAIERRYDKMIESAEKSGKDTSKLEEEKEEAVLNVKRKYADKQFALSVLQVTAATTVAAMEAYSAMAGIKFIGPVLGAAAAAAAVAAGAAQIAIAKQQRDEAKGLYTGGYSKEYVSGYTKKGDSRDVAGVIPVHKNEFVANHKAVANPAVKQFLDVFDIAQKNGTIGFINTTQILEQVRTKAGRYVGGYTDSGTATVSDNLVSGVYSSDSVKLLQLILSAIREGNGHLKIIAAKKLVVDVRSVRDGIKRLETLERNASR